MNRKTLAALALAGAVLAGCVQQSASLPADVIASLSLQVQQGKILITDLTSADWDAHQAITVGALDPSDPLPACLDAVEADVGVTGPTPPSYTPKLDGVISGGVQAYIRAQQLQKLSGGTINVPPSCDAVFGKVMRQALAAATKLGVNGLGGFLTGGAAIGLPLPLAKTR